MPAFHFFYLPLALHLSACKGFFCFCWLCHNSCRSWKHCWSAIAWHTSCFGNTWRWMTLMPCCLRPTTVYPHPMVASHSTSSGSLTMTCCPTTASTVLLTGTHHVSLKWWKSWKADACITFWMLLSRKFDVLAQRWCWSKSAGLCILMFAGND